MIPEAEKPPIGATHRYNHGVQVSWYREMENKLYVWRDGSWYASSMKSAYELAKSCPLGAVSCVNGGGIRMAVKAVSECDREILKELLIQAGIANLVEKSADELLNDWFKRG